jgi:hypothetical protein
MLRTQSNSSRHDSSRRNSSGRQGSVASTSKRFAVIGLLTAATFTGTMLPSTVSAKATAPAFGPKESPLGRPYVDWLAEWGKWAFGGPSATNPLLNLPACNSWSQPEPAKAFYLSAGGAGKAAVTCSVPIGVPIAITPGGVFSWRKLGEEAIVNSEIAKFAGIVRRPKLKVDGVSVDAAKYLVETPIGTTTIEAPEFGPILGNVLFKSKGWMLVLKGFRAGTHTVVISDDVTNADESGTPILTNGKQTWQLSQVTFTLNVGAPIPPPPAPAPAAASPATAPASPTTLATATTVAATTTTPTPTSTTAPVAAASGAAPTSGKEILFQDDFENPASGWIDDIGAGRNMGYVGGRYRIEIDPGVGGQRSPDHKGQPVLQNMRAEIDVEVSSLFAGFVFHCYDEVTLANGASFTQEPEHIYMGFSPTGVGAYVSLGGKRTSLPAARLPEGLYKTVNRAALECKGEPGKAGSIRAFLNGTMIYEADIPVMPKGSNLYPVVETFRGLPTKTTVHLDNLVVTRL